MHQLAVIRNIEKRYFITGARAVVDKWNKYRLTKYEFALQEYFEK